MPKLSAKNAKLLAPFCDEPDGSIRYQLTDPWYHNGWVYATDGRVIVRIPHLDIPCIEGRRPADPGSLFLDFDFKGKRVWCGPVLVDGPPKGVMDNWWNVPAKKASRDEVEDIKKGDPVPCDEAFEKVVCFGWQFARRYLWMISQLPGCQVHAVKKSKIPHPKPMLFKSGELQGVLLGLDPH